MKTKGIDPKKETAQATKREKFECVPPLVLKELSIAMAEGAEKYGRFNWLETNVQASTYYAAALRHLTSWYAGMNEDEDSPDRISHLTKAIASLTVLRDAQIHNNMADDRYGPVE